MSDFSVLSKEINILLFTKTCLFIYFTFIYLFFTKQLKNVIKIFKSWLESIARLPSAKYLRKSWKKLVKTCACFYGLKAVTDC